MEQILEIGGKEYTFVANRKAVLAASNASLNADKSNLLDEEFYFLLKEKHNLTKAEVSELLDQAEKEYTVGDLIEFGRKMLDEAFTQANENKKKIAFLSQK